MTKGQFSNEVYRLGNEKTGDGNLMESDNPGADLINGIGVSCFTAVKSFRDNDFRSIASDLHESESACLSLRIFTDNLKSKDTSMDPFTRIRLSRRNG